MKQYDLYALGNALVDIEIEVNEQELERLGVEKGVMTLVDEERHDYLLSHLHGNIHQRASGGSAANSVIALAQLGGKAFHSCKVGRDEAGVFYASDLNSAGVDNGLHQLEDNHGTTGKCLVMVTPDADRTMNTFLGISSELKEQDIHFDALADSQYLYLEGYLVSSPEAHLAALSAKKHAQANGVKVATTLSDPNMVRFFKPQIEQILEGGVDLLFCNDDEALEFTEQSNIHQAMDVLKQSATQVAITLGKKGALFFDGNELHTIEAHPVKAVDTNGAGDMFAGAFLYGLTQGYSFADCGKLASFAAGHLVTQFGPRLYGEAIDELRAFNQRNFAK
ncbi:adenosine kinase [Kangiella profundi]|uniref:Adenosine kinase n=1 Tax=Kangiella profundi TaxID=1561924 RepID=A0A2K9AZ58_9GAMM|nr:adenosine kinase [Kangiella profundi]AUD79169.1 adenosine kinase [Kangiella profundi]GGF00916.1 adenosine kinase [Kangiella profundi]